MIDVQYKNYLQRNTKFKIFLVNCAVYKLALHIKRRLTKCNTPEAFLYYNYFYYIELTPFAMMHNSGTEEITFSDCHQF